MATDHKQELLSADKKEVLWGRVDVCYAGIGTHNVKYKPAYIRTHWPYDKNNWPAEKFSIKDMTQYVKAVGEFFGGLKNHRELAQEMVKHKYFTVSANRTSFECVSICTALRYAWEQPWITEAFLKIKKVRPDCPGWKALLLAHNYCFCGGEFLMTGHSLISKITSIVCVNKEDVDKIIERTIRNSLKVHNDVSFGLGGWRGKDGIQPVFDSFVKSREVNKEMLSLEQKINGLVDASGENAQ